MMMCKIIITQLIFRIRTVLRRTLGVTYHLYHIINEILRICSSFRFQEIISDRRLRLHCMKHLQVTKSQTIAKQAMTIVGLGFSLGCNRTPTVGFAPQFSVGQHFMSVMRRI